MYKWFSVLCVLIVFSFCAFAQNDNVWSGQPLYGRDVTQEMRNINALEANIQGFLWNRKWGSAGMGNGEFTDASGIIVDLNGDVWVTDNDRVQQFSPDGTHVATFGSLGNGDGEFDNPEGIAIDSTGHFWVVDRSNGRVQEFDAAFAFVSKFGQGGSGEDDFDSIVGIAINSNDLLYIADQALFEIKVFDTSGVFQSAFGSFGTGNGQFKNATWVTIDALDNIYVADSHIDNQRVQKFDSLHNFITSWDTGNNRGIKFVNDGKGEWIFVSQLAIIGYDHDQIVKYDTSGNLFAIYGCGSSSSGDGQFQMPIDIAFGGNAIRVTLVGNHSAGTTTLQLDTGDVSITLNGNGNLSTPFNLVGESEQVTVSSMNVGAETVLVSRGQNGTTATSHVDGTIFFITGEALYEDFYVVDAGNSRVQAYSPGSFSQTEFFKYVESGSPSISLGTPDGGVSVPALDALDSGAAMVAPDHINDIRIAIEALAPSYRNSLNCNLFNWTGASSDNLYFVALGDRDTAPSDFGFSSPTPAYDWQRTKAQMDNSPTYDIDIGEVALCIDKLQASALE